MQHETECFCFNYSFTPSTVAYNDIQYENSFLEEPAGGAD